MSEENETDTFISVDIELSRVAINCSVCECAGWEGRVVVVVGLKFTFQSSSLSRIFFFSPRSSFLQRCCKLNTCSSPTANVVLVEKRTQRLVDEEAAGVAGGRASTTLTMASLCNHFHLGSGARPLSSHPAFRFLLFSPTLNSPVCPFDPLLAALACCRAPAASR